MKRIIFLFAILVGVSCAQAAPVVVVNYSTASAAAGPAIDLRGSGVVWHRVVITATGTVSALTFTVDTSADSSSWTSGGAISTTAAAVPPSSMTGVNGVASNYVRINPSVITGGGTVNFRYEGYLGAVDPCSASWTYKQEQVVNAITAISKVIPLTSGADTYICGAVLSNTGTTPTVAFKSGTGTTCGTNGIALSGTISQTASVPFSFGYGGHVVFDTGLSRDFCITPAGGTPSMSGLITYVVQPE